MEKKVVVIGLGPEYNYDSSNHELWEKDSTKYASNHGASLIARTLIEYFDADFIQDVSNPEKYIGKYELCVMAFATHITVRRDVSVYTNFVKKLGIKTTAFSLGIQDYSRDTSEVNNLHPSMKELLTYVLSTTSKIGVRGPHTASLLLKEGFRSKDILRFGCPTLYRNLDPNLQVKKGGSIKKTVVVFHRTMADLTKNILSDVTLLGQDFLDEAVFDESFNRQNKIRDLELEAYGKLKNGKLVLDKIKENGVFPRTFDEWFNEIGKADFVFGPRLHGCVAALIQGIPAVMIARDMRVQEIAEFYKIPFIKYEDVGEMTIQEIYDQADFTEFNKLYKIRFNNFIKLMSENDVLKYLRNEADFEVVPEYVFTHDDMVENDDIIFREFAQQNARLEKIIVLDEKIDKLEKKLQKITSYISWLPKFLGLKKK